MEKVLWLIERVKSGLWSFMLEISCWMILQSSKPAEVDSNQIKTLIENSQSYTTKLSLWEIANILKVSKSIKLLVKMKNVSFILWVKKP